MAAAAQPADLELAAMVAEYYDDPLGWVMDAYPWGEGELAGEAGPDVWQRALLVDIGAAVKERGFNGVDAVLAILFAVASGHGIGKSTMMAWIANWIMSTRPDSQGTVTANTFTQLETKTWAAIQRWTRLSITKDWWVVMGRGLYHRDARSTWFLNCQTCAEENSESFAGQHAKNSTSYYLLDESSAIPEKTWEVLQGGLTDGEPMVFAFGNPTRNTGQFYEACFGSRRHRWNHRSIDSRTCKFSNKAQIDEWLQDYGVDSDFFKVRVLGQPPQQAEDQLIGRDLVRSAMARTVRALDDDPLICGVDVPDGGSAWFIIRYRRGLDARNVPAPVRMPGSRVDRQQMIAICGRIMAEGVVIPGGSSAPVRPAAMFVDSAFGSPIVERLHTMGHDRVVEINFGGKSPDPHYANMRAYMWGKQVKEFLERGSIDPNDKKLEVDLTGPGWHYNRTNAVVVESKQDMAARGIPSPDDGDALALTFARPVAPQKLRTATAPTPRLSAWS